LVLWVQSWGCNLMGLLFEGISYLRKERIVHTRKSVIKFKNVENSTFAVSRENRFRYSGSCSEMAA
jgi:hypothetical protein